MQTVMLAAGHFESLDRALAILRDGGLVAFPTDTVYGLGALAFDSEAIEHIYIVKRRLPEKAIPVLIGETADLERIGSGIPMAAWRLAERFWPGPLTLIVRKNAGLPEAVSASATVGVRVPDHPTARTLLRRAGPMAVTSANLSGEPSASSAQEVMAQLGGRIDLIIDGGKTTLGVASTVVDVTGPEISIVRVGSVTLADIRAALL